MNRGAGMGVMALGIVLVVVGAIMKFAVSARTHGFDINKAGLILLLAGIAVFIVSLFVFFMGGRTRSTTRTDVRETASGQERTEKRDDWTT
jgi:membrane-bound ClpP family serine protease